MYQYEKNIALWPAPKVIKVLATLKKEVSRKICYFLVTYNTESWKWYFFDNPTIKIPSHNTMILLETLKKNNNKTSSKKV
jgi:hypothetical protein